MFSMKSIVVLAAIFAGAASYAQETLSREDVRAETTRARAAGEMAGINEAWDGMTIGPKQVSGVFGRPFAEPGLTREAVMAEYERARSRGEIEQHRLIYATGGD